MAEDSQATSKRALSPQRDYTSRSKKQKVAYKSGDRVQAKWPGSVNDRLWPGTILRDTLDQCLIEFDHGHERLTVQNINVQRLPPEADIKSSIGRLFALRVLSLMLVMCAKKKEENSENVSGAAQHQKAL